LSETRLRLVKEAFNKIDKNGNGTLELDEVKDSYDAGRHPLVLSGFRSESSVKSEFLAMFSVNHNTSTKSKDNDGVVDIDEFIQYHQLISPLVERDCEWRNMLVGVWNMDIVPVDKRVAGSHPQVYGKNSRE
jgi:Ca2+-binding EF-hand superfamily protein